MDLIKEFAFILSKKQPSDFDLFLPKGSKHRKLFEIIIENKANNNEDAARLIYGKAVVNKKFLMLKKHLIEKLSEQLLIAEYPDKRIHYKFWCENQLQIAEKLLLQNVYHNAVKIVKRVLQKAIELDFSDIVVESYKKLRKIYALKGFPKETLEFELAYKEALKIQENEETALGFLQLIQSKTKFSVAVSNRLVKDIKAYFNSIQNHLNNEQSIHYKFYTAQIQSYLHAHQQEFNAQKECLELIRKLINTHHSLKTEEHIFWLHLEFAQLHRNTSQLEASEQKLIFCLNHSSYAAYNKFVVQGLHYDLCLKKGLWMKGLGIIKEVFETEQFVFLDPIDKAGWEIRKLYLHYLTFFNKELGKDHWLKQVTINLYQNPSRYIKHDKEGYKIMYMIIRLLLFKINGSKNIENEGQNLLIYYHRNLKNLANLRTNVFFKAIARVCASNFNASIVEKEKEKLDKFMRKNTTYDTTELIPYPHLWLTLTEPDTELI